MSSNEEVTKAIKEWEVQLQNMTDEQKTQVSLYLGDREFTPEQLLNEMVENGEYAPIIAQMINKHLIELAKIEQE